MCACERRQEVFTLVCNNEGAVAYNATHTHLLKTMAVLLEKTR